MVIKFPRKRSSKKQNNEGNNAPTPTKMTRSSVLSGFRPSHGNLKYAGIEDEKKEDDFPLNEKSQNHLRTRKPLPPKKLTPALETKKTPSINGEQENHFASENELEHEECHLFEDQDEPSPERRVQTVVDPLPTPFLPMPMPLSTPLSPNKRQTSTKSFDEAYAIPERHNSRPPSEINIDLQAVPPSPIRDPSISFQQLLSPPEDLLHPSLAHDHQLAQVPVYLGSDQGLQTQLCDAERLVRIILGTSQQKPLESGSILQAIRTFAVMKQELIELRKYRETTDGDPPAILTQLTSPATTKNSTSIMSTPLKSRSLMSTPLKSQSLSSGPPKEIRITSPDDSEKSNFRKALVLAARRCQTLEEQLKKANETIDEMQTNTKPVVVELESTSKPSLVQEIERLRAENVALRKGEPVPEANEPPIDVEAATTEPVELAVSKTDGEQGLLESPTPVVNGQNKEESKEGTNEEEESEECEENPLERLESAHARIEALKQRLDEASCAQEVASLAREAKDPIVLQNERIAELEASQIRLQALLRLALQKHGPSSNRCEMNGIWTDATLVVGTGEVVEL